MGLWSSKPADGVPVSEANDILKGEEATEKPDDFLDFPFLKDDLTTEYVSGSKIMFIMRGLPGSGKTTIVQEIKKVYKEAVVCSADEFFLSCGKYEFDPSKLRFAHEFCQERAQNSCRSDINVVVIDNTNVQKWQLDYYTQLARAMRYVVIAVEPKTPWKFDPKVLATLNAHNVPYNDLVRKLEQWEVVLPVYYGWFLNEADSKMLNLIGQAYLEECLKVPMFEYDFKKFSNTVESKEILDYYKGGKNLHCTAKFCGNADDGIQYSKSTDVIKGYGQCYDICIVGLIISPRTFGARVKLDEEELKLWGNDESPSSPRRQVLSSPHKFLNNRRYHFESNKNPDTVSCQATLVCSPQKDMSFQPTRGMGSRAHITLGCAYGVSPVTSGFDLLEVIDCESQTDNGNSVQTFQLSRGVLRCYGNSLWVLYLNQKINVNTIFTGYY